ncbi:MAG TPA: A/G-specific adenine glycosylase, partial [Lysinibacillus sp.]|nr:A/G-specific adenine glycosylase [Lysinibacillus sp.]
MPKTKKVFEVAVEKLIDPEHASSFNQGLMELGALICTPTSPKCLLCPVREYCTAFNEGEPDKLPVKSKKIKMKHLTYDVLVCEDENGRFLMQQRPEKGLLANLWQFPMIDTSQSTVENFKKEFTVNVHAEHELLTFKHVFSHLTWHINSYYMKCESFAQGDWLSREQIERLPMPVPMLKIWEEVKK